MQVFKILSVVIVALACQVAVPESNPEKPMVARFISRDDFYAGEVKLPSGDYSVYLSGKPLEVLLAKSDWETDILLKVIVISGPSALPQSTITFHKYGDTAFLHGITAAGPDGKSEIVYEIDASAAEILRSKTEALQEYSIRAESTEVANGGANSSYVYPYAPINPSTGIRVPVPIMPTPWPQEPIYPQPLPMYPQPQSVSQSPGAQQFGLTCYAGSFVGALSAPALAGSQCYVWVNGDSYVGVVGVDPGLGGQVNSQNVDWGGSVSRPVSQDTESIGTFPSFPWPPPTASAREVLPPTILTTGSKQSTLGDIDAILVKALDKNGYVERAYFAVPGGFALVTRLEQIDLDGKPMSPPARWSDHSTLSLQNFSLREYLRSLLTANPGYYRIIAFVVTPVSFSESKKIISEAESSDWLRSGSNYLPGSVARMPSPANVECTALVYEFKRRSAATDSPDQITLLLPSQLDSHVHLVNSGLWASLESH
jgi:hypothetical protein